MELSIDVRQKFYCRELVRAVFDEAGKSVICFGQLSLFDQSGQFYSPSPSTRLSLHFLPPSILHALTNMGRTVLKLELEAETLTKIDIYAESISVTVCQTPLGDGLR